MEHIQEVRVLYADTDSYGVVWHGSYTKWFEAARVEFTEKLGIDLETLENNKIVFPVVELNIRYKSSARMNERLVIKTKISELTPLRITFEHQVVKKDTDIVRVIAHSTIVVVDANGMKMFRKMPQDLFEKFSSALD